MASPKPQPKPNPRAQDNGKPKFSSNERAMLRRAGYGDAEIETFESKGLADSSRKSVFLGQVEQQIAQAEAQIYGINADILTSRIWTTRDTPAGAKGAMDTPRYEKTIGDFIKEPYRWDSEKIGSIQDRLVSAGLLAKNSFRRGIYDAATMKAYAELGTEALIASRSSGRDVTPDDILSQYAGTVGKIQKQPFVAPQKRVLDDDTIDAGINNAFLQAFHRLPSPDEIAKFRANFRGKEDVEYSGELAQAKAQYEGQVNDQPGGGAKVVNAPSPEAMTVAQLVNTPEYRGFQMALGLTKIFDMMRGSAGDSEAV